MGRVLVIIGKVWVYLAIAIIVAELSFQFSVLMGGPRSLKLLESLEHLELGHHCPDRGAGYRLS